MANNLHSRSPKNQIKITTTTASRKKSVHLFENARIQKIKTIVQHGFLFGHWSTFSACFFVNSFWVEFHLDFFFKCPGLDRYYWRVYKFPVRNL